MELQKVKKALNQIIKYKRHQFKAAGDNGMFRREITCLNNAVKNIENALILEENKELKNLLVEGLKLMERMYKS